MKLSREMILRECGCSAAYRFLNWERFPFLWHAHAEIELTFIRKGRGQRFVGDHIERFVEGDLILLGPDLPHTWASSPDLPQRAGICRSIVIQFDQHWLGDGPQNMPEFSGVQQLFARSRRGLQFTGAVANDVSQRMIVMEKATPLSRLALLLECLDLLARDRRATPLSSEGFRPETTLAHRGKIAEVCAFLQREFTGPTSIEAAAEIACLSVGAFSRVFLKSTGRNFTDYVNELRIARACELLIESELKIATIAMDAGFGNLSNFNRQFVRRRNCTPRQFRAAHSA